MYNNKILTPTRAVQNFIDCKKSGSNPSEEVFSVLKTFRKWKETELIGLLNASNYYPEIFIEENMESTINHLLQNIKKRFVPHKF
jgi:hypothetical protein